MAQVDQPPLGRRERKKQRTRQDISDVATRLFARDGFEEVTLAQIAEAADVSVKTIFNHFGGKEELFFDRADELRHAIAETVAERPPGTTILGALRALLTDNLVPFPGTGWDWLEDPERRHGFRHFRATERRSPALTAWRLRFSVELGRHLAGVLAAELDRDGDDLAVRTLATMLLGAFALREDALDAAVLADASPAEIRRRAVAVVDEAFDRLEAAFADLDRRRPD